MNTETKSEKKVLLTRDRQFYRMLGALAVPISLQNLITFAVNFADNLMVSKLGDTAVSGVYMGNQIQFFLQMLLTGVAEITGILTAQYWGKRDTDTIRKIASFSMRIGLFIGILTMLVTAFLPTQLLGLLTDDAAVIDAGKAYISVTAWSFVFYAVSQVIIAVMRSVESARVGMYISLLALFVNIGLNAVFIFGMFGFPAMGIGGAALATLISRIVEMAAAVLYAARIDKKLMLRLSDFRKRTDRQLIRDYIRWGTPVMCGDIVWAVNTFAQSAILGHLSAAVITASSITGNMHTLVYIWVTGLSSAVGVITGKTVGAGNVEKVKEYARTTQILFLFVGMFTSGFIFLFRKPFVALFSDVSAEAVGFAMQFLIVLAVSMCGSCYQMPCLSGLVKAGGDISFVFKNDTFHVFCIVLPSAYLASKLGAPAWVVFSCLKIDQILKCFVAVIKVNRYQWIRNLTH